MIEQLRTKIEAYNTALSIIDSSKVEIEELERNLGDVSEKMLLGVAFKYGKDSSEYQMAGGVRKSDRDVSPHERDRLLTSLSKRVFGNREQYTDTYASQFSALQSKASENTRSHCSCREH